MIHSVTDLIHRWFVFPCFPTWLLYNSVLRLTIGCDRRFGGVNHFTPEKKTWHKGHLFSRRPNAKSSFVYYTITCTFMSRLRLWQVACYRCVCGYHYASKKTTHRQQLPLAKEIPLNAGAWNLLHQLIVLPLQQYHHADRYGRAAAQTICWFSAVERNYAECIMLLALSSWLVTAR